MSVNAYYLEEVRYRRPNTFNLWHHQEFCQKLDGFGALASLNSEGTGIVEIKREWIKELKKEGAFYSAETREIIAEIEKLLDEAKSESIEFYCI